MAKEEIRHYLNVFLSAIVSLLIGFAVSAIFIVSVGANPLSAFISLVDGAFGSLENISETLVKATPLIFTGLACAVAFRSNAQNIGAEGQLYMGAIATAVVGLSLPRLPSVLFVPIILLSGFAAGAFWASIPGFLKIKYGANEIVTTLLMNWIPFYFVQYIVTGPFQEKDKIRPQTDFLPPTAWLAPLLPGHRVHLGIIIAVASCLLAYLLLHKTSIGFEFRATGSNPLAAKSSGISIERRIMQAMIISGGLAALAGFSEVAGTVRTLKLGSSNLLGYGYAGILVALVTKLHPIGVIFSGLFFGSLIVGSESMQLTLGVPISIVYMIEGVMVVAILTSSLLLRKVRIPWLT